ncbi:MAG: hypothetical protein ACPLYC_01575, partial [Minisyncoccia bacterium]
KNNIKTDKLVISNPDRTKKFVSVFIFEPNELLKKENGQMAFLLEIEYQFVPLPEDLVWAKEFVEKLINYLEINYYQSPASSLEIDKNFENLIQGLNQWLATELHQQLFLNLVILVIDNANLYFSAIGNILAYLHQQNKLIPLLEPRAEQNQSPKFSNIVSGVLEADDKILFATDNLFDYFSEQKIETILKRDIKFVFKKIFEHIKELRNKISLAALLIQHQMKQPEEIPKEESAPVVESKQKMETTKLSQSKISISKTADELPKELLIEKKPLNLERPEFKSIFMKFVSLVNRLALIIIRKLKINILKLKFNQLSYLQKTLIILLLIIIIVFVQSLITFGRQEYNKQLTRKYADLVKIIQDKQNEINAALIYKDESKVKLLLKELDVLLNKLPQRTLEQKQMYDFFNQILKDQIAKLYRQEYVAEPKILVDLSNVDNKIKIGSLAKLGNKI